MRKKINFPLNTRVPSSFRDPSGFVFKKDNRILRQINNSYKRQYDRLQDGLYQDLLSSSLIIPHQETHDIELPENAYKIIEPEIIPFVSYPYEWSFSQLQDAATTTLEIQKKALQHGMTLKDASAYNIQFLNGKPIFIDSLSFDIYKEGAPWIAYKQFCEHFLAPLSLMAYTDVSLGQLSRIHIDGIPLKLAHSLLPRKTMIKPSLLMHIHMHGKLQDKSSRSGEGTEATSKTISLTGLRGLIDSLHSSIRKLKWAPQNTEWAEYENDDSYNPGSLAHKKELVSKYLHQSNPAQVWDLGWNTGVFSRLASESGAFTVSFDKDPAAIEKNYLTTKTQREKNILPLIMDLSNPSSMIGWANQERLDLSNRASADMIFALALVHHLAISQNVPLSMIADYLSTLCEWLIIEFIPKEDKKVDILLSTREDIFPNYNIVEFESQFANKFDILSKDPIKDSLRTMFLMRKKHL